MNYMELCQACDSSSSLNDRMIYQTHDKRHVSTYLDPRVISSLAGGIPSQPCNFHSNNHRYERPDIQPRVLPF
ncbi:hypothetical protein PM082_005257 [Marasmius tenuissimus]|nr:hypothetical protein PM082_005257 [Marasmius tenuissimus]